MNSNFYLIEDSLNKFISKYYLNKSFNGLVSSLLFIIFSFFFFLSIEYFFYLSSSIRKYLIILYFLISILYFLVSTIFPFLRYLRKFSTLSYKQSSDLIQKHFPEIKDRLINVIELNSSKDSIFSNELVIASINQKTKYLSKFDFKTVINYKAIFIKLYFLLFINLVVIGIFYFNSSLIINPSKRLINYNITYNRPTDFDFILLNDSLIVGKGGNIKVMVQINSKKLFENSFIVYSGSSYLMKNDSSNIFSYTFDNLNNSLKFNILVNNSISDTFSISVLSLPIIKSMTIEVDKPFYTNLKRERFDNLSEITVPQGSNCSLFFKAFSTDSIIIYNEDLSDVQHLRFKEDYFYTTFVINKNIIYNVKLFNKNFTDDFLSIKFNCVFDNYPFIEVISQIDSTNFNINYFKGLIRDDYGFSKLNFVIKDNRNSDTIIPVIIDKNILDQNFFYGVNFEVFKLFGEEIKYYFEIFDNDEVNGAKSSVSEVFTFKFPSFIDIIEKKEESFNEILSLINKSQQLSNSIEKRIDDLNSKLINDKISDWERKEILSNIIKEKDQLQNVIDEIKNKNTQIDNFLKSFNEQNTELVEKQKQIQEMLDNMLSKEMKDLLQKYQDLLKSFDSKKFNELKKESEMSLKDLSKQLDKNLELLRNMKVKDDILQITKKLDELKRDQSEKANLIEKNIPFDSLRENQNSKLNEFNTIQLEFNKIIEFNNKLENPIQIDPFKNEFDDIKKNFEEIQNSENSNKKKKKENFNNNSSDLEQLSFKIKSMASDSEENENKENLEDLKVILSNLIKFSFQNEQNLLKNTSKFYLPVFSKNFQSIKENFKIINDSLYQLSKRELSISSIINNEVFSINKNLEFISVELSDNKILDISKRQQFIMTSTNNLALFLSEIIKQLEKQQNSSNSSGNKNCNKPGTGKPSMNSMKDLEKSLSKQLEQLQQQIQKGGDKGKMSEGLGQALQQQEMLQNALRELMNDKSVGSSARETLKSADQLLESTKRDILNKSITQETINRQKQILTRLLESEKSENEREKDENRKSESAKDQYINNNLKNLKLNENNIDNFNERLLKSKLILNPYYHNKFQMYLLNLDSIRK